MLLKTREFAAQSRALAVKKAQIKKAKDAQKREEDAQIYPGALKQKVHWGSNQTQPPKHHVKPQIISKEEAAMLSMENIPEEESEVD